jgi:4-amino-4-deoxy-L-arabinose transferase-like glycosyltransferase
MSRFARRLAAVAAVAFGVRVAYVLALGRDIKFGLDAVWYELVSATIASGDGFVDPGLFFGRGVAVPTAFRPPLYPGFLAVVNKTVGHTSLTFQLVGCVTGALTVMLVGHLGRRVGGPAVGLCAACLAAVYPVLIAIDASIMSETIYVPLVTASVLAVYRALERPTVLRWVVVGALIGLSVLARGDGILLVPLLIAPVGLLARGVAPTRRLLLTGVSLLAAALVIAPWVVRNEARLGRPTLATLDVATAIAGANCPATYYGRRIGSWEHGCTVRPNEDELDELALTDELQQDGIDYALGHERRMPLVAAVRALRLWGLYDPVGESRRETVESRIFSWQVFAWFAYAPLALLTVYGFVLLVRRRFPVLPLVAVLVAVTLTAVLVYGKPRFRASAEPVLLVAASVAIIHLGGIARTRARAGPERTTPAPVTHVSATGSARR